MGTTGNADPTSPGTGFPGFGESAPLDVPTSDHVTAGMVTRSTNGT